LLQQRIFTTDHAPRRHRCCLRCRCRCHRCCARRWRMRSWRSASAPSTRSPHSARPPTPTSPRQAQLVFLFAGELICLAWVVSVRAHEMCDMHDAAKMTSNDTSKRALASLEGRQQPAPPPLPPPQHLSLSLTPVCSVISDDILVFRPMPLIRTRAYNVCAQAVLFACATVIRMRAGVARPLV
jgi:hypothetical protein